MSATDAFINLCTMTMSRWSSASWTTKPGCAISRTLEDLPYPPYRDGKADLVQLRLQRHDAHQPALLVDQGTPGVARVHRRRVLEVGLVIDHPLGGADDALA